MLPLIAPGEVRRRILAVLRRELREGRLTQRQAAVLAGCTQPHISNIVTGTRLLSEAQADELLETMRPPAAQLYSAEEIDKLRSWLAGDAIVEPPRKRSRVLAIDTRTEPEEAA